MINKIWVYFDKNENKLIMQVKKSDRQKKVLLLQLY